MATETSGELTNDELTVLMVASRGESMIPIGRWAQSLKSLAARDYMRARDEANYVITDAGRRAMDEADDANIRAMIVGNNKAADATIIVAASAGVLAKPSVDPASVQLAARAIVADAMTGSLLGGGTAKEVARRLHDLVWPRCLELLNGSD